MDGFKKTTSKVRRGHTYTWYVLSSTQTQRKPLPALLFQHGWPDHAEMWQAIAMRLREHHHVHNTIIIPDMLGYDGTSKPTSPAEYRFDHMTQDMVDILDAEEVSHVISIGHDWGCRAASRLYNYHPDRVQGLILLNVGYAAPEREPFDLDASNAMTTKHFGYPCFDYWHLFTAPDGPQILRDNVSRVYSAIHAEGADSMRRYLCVPGFIRQYLTASNDEIPEPEVRSYARDPARRQAFVDRMTRDGFDAPQCWYRAMRDNVQLEAAQTLSTDRDKVNVPVLYIGATQDAVCRPEHMIPAKMNGLLPDLEEHMVDAGHWCPDETPNELAALIADWIEKRGFGA